MSRAANFRRDKVDQPYLDKARTERRQASLVQQQDDHQHVDAASARLSFNHSLRSRRMQGSHAVDSPKNADASVRYLASKPKVMHCHELTEDPKVFDPISR